jgi:outer membrane protein assembly factor BamE (lipoprotein component of BamABCDE complex)
MMKRHIITMVVLALVTWGCAPSTITRQPAKTEIGIPIDITKYDQIIEGKTTEPQVIALFGTPSRTMDKPDGKVLQYVHFETQHSGNLASTAGTTGASSHTMVMFKISKGVVVKKAKMVGSQPIQMKPETVTITPGKK